MQEFEIIFYEKANGETPVEKFLDSLDKKMRAKAAGLIKILGEKGYLLREPYSKYLDEGIFELRIQIGNDISRILYFFYYNGRIVLTNGFIKKHKRLQSNN